MNMVRRLPPLPGESHAEHVARQRLENLRVAAIQRQRHKVLRQALRLRVIDDLELLRGNNRDFESVIQSWKIERLLLMFRGIGAKRASDVLILANIHPQRRVRDLSFAERFELARLVDEARTSYTL